MQRLLRCCDELATELHTRETQRKLATFVSVLERYWHEVDAAGDCIDDEMGEYWRKIEALAELISDEKLLSASSGLVSRVHSNSRLTRSEANAELSNRLNAANRVQQALREQLMVHVEGEGAQTEARSRHGGLAAEWARPAVAVAAAPLAQPATPHVEAEASVEAASVGVALEREREAQDALVDDSAQMLNELHKKMLRQRDAVNDDLRVLDDTSDVLDANAATMEATNERLRQQVQKMQGSTCLVWLMVLVVCLAFMGTFLFMKAVPKPRPH
eukprot:CAMPEP_0183354296 /NCGR_PEP_ID=MMETSP0164_2-20130417/37227_1 /TAXON_ID=221442 /ORGANISM="Coccolithus pelagicus ssp braarudi, Strain PLY182g" /LENGTH=272 /DNA_ID=CAMNT_0025527151 /DNA_START=138 /DNA_END=956 /DNA_ORIENTATION=-